MNKFDQTYQDLLTEVLAHSEDKGDRTGTGTRSVFGTQAKFDLSEGFPLLTTKKMFTKAIIHELLWFIKGETNIQYLLENGVSIWNEWTPAYKRGGQAEVDRVFKESQREYGGSDFPLPDLDLGPVYGSQWRNWAVPKEVQVDNGNGNIGLDVEYEYIDQLGEVIERIKTNPNSRS